MKFADLFRGPGIVETLASRFLGRADPVSSGEVFGSRVLGGARRFLRRRFLPAREVPGKSWEALDMEEYYDEAAKRIEAVRLQALARGFLARRTRL